MELPAGLSASPFKRAVYGLDTFAIEGWAHFTATLGDPHGFAERHTYLLVKPEAVITGRLERISAWWIDEGFSAVATRSLRFNRWMVRALWGYHWNAVTEQHRRAVDRIMLGGSSAVILLRDLSGQRPSASARLARLKGPADPSRRSEGELRYILGGEGGPLLNFVHSPDEPLDFVREMAVLLDGESLKVMLDRAARDGDDEVGNPPRQLWRELYASAGAPEPSSDTALWSQLVESVQGVESQAQGVERLLASRQDHRCNSSKETLGGR